jgi:hypothetical protein
VFCVCCILAVVGGRDPRGRALCLQCGCIASPHDDLLVLHHLLCSSLTRKTEQLFTFAWILLLYVVVGGLWWAPKFWACQHSTSWHSMSY